MEAERIKVVRKWPEPKSVRHIQVFLDFANFYRRFIQGFSKIAVLLTYTLKIVAPLEKSTSEEIGDDKSGDGVDGGGVEIAKMSEKSKGQKTSKSQKSAKSQKSFKLGKNLSKNGNSPNFGATETGPSFLTLEARSAFNHLRLTFIEALILQYFDPECHI